MIQFAIGVLLGGFIGMAATCMCVAASDRTESACAEAYEAGKRDGYDQGEKDGWELTCAKLRTDCPVYERFIERGD